MSQPSGDISTVVMLKEVSMGRVSDLLLNQNNIEID